MVSNKYFKLGPTVKAILEELAIIILVIVWLIPVYAMIINGFKSNAAVFTSKVLVPVWPFTLTPYQEAWATIARSLLNSIAITVPVSILGAFLGALGAYYLNNLTTSFNPKLRILGNVIFVLVTLGTFLPYQATMMPMTILMSAWNLLGTYWGLLIAYLTFYLPTGALLMSIFIATVPSYLIEAAKMDGASDFDVFFKVVLPVSLPGFISTLIFILIESWNVFFLPLVLVTNPNLQVAAVAIRSFTGGYGTFYNTSFAAAALSIIIPLAIFIFLGRYFMRGILALGGGAKA